MSVQKRPTPEQWQQLVEQWQDSGLPAIRFCKLHEIGYASFCNWRKRLTETALQTGPAATSEPTFIDLNTLQSPDSTPDTGWNIVLSLGNGVELRLSQHCCFPLEARRISCSAPSQPICVNPLMGCSHWSKASSIITRSVATILSL